MVKRLIAFPRVWKAEEVSMRFRILLLVLVSVAFTSQGYSQGLHGYSQEGSGCGEALVIATYNRAQIEHDDWRLASYVTENEYNTIKHDAGVNAVIYDVPVGASYSDFQNRVQERTNSYKESLTHDQAINVMWTGLDPNAANAYSDCLRAKIFNQAGLHFGVKSATKNQVSVVIVWIPTGDERKRAAPVWAWEGNGRAALPKSVPSGTTVVVLPRPNEQQILAANYKGHADELIIEPFPPPPTKAEFRAVESDEEYRSPEITAWGDRWSVPYTLCTPEKPTGWIIVKVHDFHLESATERNVCGRWTTCTGSESDSSAHACRTVSVQGHNDNKYDGYGKAVAVFHVTWKHPEKTN
jgi:hypothetical protein